MTKEEFRTLEQGDAVYTQDGLQTISTIVKGNVLLAVVQPADKVVSYMHMEFGDTQDEVSVCSDGDVLFG